MRCSCRFACFLPFAHILRKERLLTDMGNDFSNSVFRHFHSQSSNTQSVSAFSIVEHFLKCIICVCTPQCVWRSEGSSVESGCFFLPFMGAGAGTHVIRPVQECYPAEPLTGPVSDVLSGISGMCNFTLFVCLTGFGWREGLLSIYQQLRWSDLLSGDKGKISCCFVRHQDS